MISNHTFANEILRQPGVFSEGITPDETLYKAVGDEMAAENGYANVFSYTMGDHVGTTDGWSYYTTGGLGYVIETGPNYFHPLYAETIQEYDGSAVPGGGNSEAFYVAMESAANRAHHAVLRATRPPARSCGSRSPSRTGPRSGRRRTSTSTRASRCPPPRASSGT